MTPELRITVLMENTAREGLEAEHGLSFFLEYRGRCFLLDAGSSGRFADNAQKLGVDLDGVELAALSHGHYDHADGLRAFFALNDRAPVYIRPQAGRLTTPSREAPPDLWASIGRSGRASGTASCRWMGCTPSAPGGWLAPETVRAGPLPAGSPICCARWGRTGSCPTTFPTSSPWCWRPGGGWWCSTPAAMGVW